MKNKRLRNYQQKIEALVPEKDELDLPAFPYTHEQEKDAATIKYGKKIDEIDSDASASAFEATETVRE